MSFRIIVRGSPSRFVAAEYECPEHGRFAVDVQRDEHGDPPAHWPCPEVTGEVIPPALVFGEDDVDLVEPEFATCDKISEWRISAPLGKVKIAEVQRGKSDERPPWALNTEALADGMPIEEWRAQQDKLDRDLRIRKNREAL